VSLTVFDSTALGSIRVIAISVPLASTRVKRMGNLHTINGWARHEVLCSHSGVAAADTIILRCVGTFRRFEVTYCLNFQSQAIEEQYW